MQAIPRKAVLLILPVNAFIVLHREIEPAPFSAIFLRHVHEFLMNPARIFGISMDLSS
jgi:hypothetical protein